MHVCVSSMSAHMCMCTPIYKSNQGWKPTQGRRKYPHQDLAVTVKGRNVATGLGAGRVDLTGRLCLVLKKSFQLTLLFSEWSSRWTDVRLKEQIDVKVFWETPVQTYMDITTVSFQCSTEWLLSEQHASQVKSILIIDCFLQRKKGCEQFCREAVIFNFSIISKTKKAKFPPHLLFFKIKINYNPNILTNTG